ENLTRPTYATATLQGLTQGGQASSVLSMFMTQPGSTVSQAVLSPTTPTNASPTGSTPGLYSSQDTPRIASLHTPTTLPVSPSPNVEQSFPPMRPRRKRRGLLVALIALVLLVLGSTAIGAIYFFSHKSNVSNPIVGYAFFVSSGQLSNSNSQGIND